MQNSANGATRERVEHCLYSGRRYLEHCTYTARAAAIGCSVEIAVAALNGVCPGAGAVWICIKGMDHRLGGRATRDGDV